MSRVINPDGVGKERNRLMKALAIALRELAQHNRSDSHARDLAAFMVFVLDGVAGTIERTVAPWEKRDYWLKADKFRMEWAWAGKLAAELRRAVLHEDWPEIGAVVAQLGPHTQAVKLGKNHRLGTPWQGAWGKLLENERGPA